MYNGYLDKCMPSEIMRSYLKNQELDEWQATSIIIGAPVSIYEKLGELQKLSDSLKELPDKTVVPECKKAVNRIKKAIDYLESEGIFSVEKVSFDEESNSPKWELATVCDTIDAVKDYIREYDETYPPYSDEYRWYDATKWERGLSGQYGKISNYYIAAGKILYADIEEDHIGENPDIDCRNYFSSYYMGELRIPVPFKAGDIIEADGYPYGPKARMVILRVGDNIDCCCLQALAKDKDGRWKVGAVKHGHVPFGYTPQISSLFSARLYEGELLDRERSLLDVSRYIAGSEERGEKLYGILIGSQMSNQDKSLNRSAEGFSDLEIMAAIATAGK